MMNGHKSINDCLCNEVIAVLLPTSCLQWDDVHTNEKMVSGPSNSIPLDEFVGEFYKNPSSSL